MNASHLGSLILSPPRRPLAPILPCVRSVLGVLVRELKVLQVTRTVSPCRVPKLAANLWQYSQLRPYGAKLNTSLNHIRIYLCYENSARNTFVRGERATPLLLEVASVEGQQMASVGDAGCSLIPPHLDSAWMPLVRDNVRRYISVSRHMCQSWAHLDFEGGCIYPFLQQRIPKCKRRLMSTLQLI